jgi:DNA-binding transcriptional LysR family regulator
MVDHAPLRNLNLNLLLHLDALLTYHSVSRAAEQIGLSQPTLSAALQRLRRHFHDELLVRTNNRSELTPLGADLRPLVAAALASAERVFTSTTVFDPATSTREFCLIASDYWVAVLGAALAEAVARLGATVRLRFTGTTPETTERTVELLRTVDGVVIPHGDLHGVRHTDLLTAEWVCIADPANSRIGESLTKADLSALPWVNVAGTPVYSAVPWESFALRQLRQAGVEPAVSVTVESFLAVPWFIAGTDRIAVVHRQMAHRLADPLGLRVLACPVELRPLRVALWWHPQFAEDLGHRWLRALLTSVAADLVV